MSAWNPDRLMRLRQDMRSQGIHAFVLTVADEFQSEYPADYAKRLEWATGFTGSNGVAIIADKAAIIFTDGRYATQVNQEVDVTYIKNKIVAQKLFDVEELSLWMSQKLTPDQILGYDPWIMTPRQIQLLTDAADRCQIRIKAVAKNPIDTTWTDQPEKPQAPVAIHLLDYAGKFSEVKRKDIAASLYDQGVNAAVLTAADSIAWLLNIRGADMPFNPLALSYAVIHADESVDWFIDSKKIGVDIQQHVGAHVRIKPIADFIRHLDLLSGQKVLVDYATIPQAIVDKLTAVKAQIIKGQDPCVLPKAIKNKVEIKGAKNAHIRDGVALVKFLHWYFATVIERNLSELECVDKLHDIRTLNKLFQQESFDTICGAGANGAIIHYRATEDSNRVIKKDDVVLLDSGAQYLDGTTDVTRTFTAAVKPSADVIDFYTRVLKGHIAIARSVFLNGTTGAHLDILARQPLWDIGANFNHGTGHGIGSYLCVHEGPQRLSPSGTDTPLQPGMLLSNEPGYYRVGEFGIRLENIILVTPWTGEADDGQDFLCFDNLTFVPFQRELIKKTLLSKDELKWLNDYHQLVFDTLSPYLDADEKEWLKRATVKI